MNGEPPKYHHRHWIWHVALDLSRGTGVGNRSHCQRIVADDSSPSANHIGARCATLLVLECPATKPVIQRGLAAFKIGNAVLAGEPLRWPEWRLWVHFSHGARVLRRRRSLAFAAAGRSSSVVKLLNCSSVSAK